MELIGMYNEIDYYIENYPDNAAVLKRIKDKIINIEKQLKEEYSLVFMAEKGAGKTTTIDFLLGLTFERSKTNEKTKKKYIVEEDVLETGAGATTTSEVEICQSNDLVSKIVVTPYSVEEIKDILKIFANTIFSNAHNLKGNEEQLAPELLRACRNMSGLTEKKSEEIGKVDQAIELALKFNINDYSSFEEEVIGKSKLLDRIQTEFIFDNVGLERAWIKKIFRRLNLVHIENAPLPKKITVKLSREIFDFSKLNRINKIIDTRGLEVTSNTDRNDIKNVFRDGENNILLFVDKFNSPSKSIIDLLDHYVYDEEMDVVDRLGYIVNFRDGEAKRVVGCDGIIDNEEEGIAEKRNQVKQIFKDNEVYIKNENIIYCNPKRHLDEEGKIKISIDELEEYDYDKEAIIEVKKEERDIERSVFIDNVISFVYDYDKKLNFELEDTLSKYNDIKCEIEKKSTLDVEPIIDYIESEELNINLEEKVGEIYDEYIGNKFPSTLMAINKRFGIYNNNDIYCEGANSIEELVRPKLKKFKDEIIAKLNLESEYKPLNNNQQKAKEFLIKDINKYFFKYIEEINTFFYNELKEDIFAQTNEEFWDKVKSRWGKGSGYRRDVLNMYKDNLFEQKFNITIDYAVKKLINEFKNNVVDILNNLDLE